jgi:putative transcriptional regulator
VSAVTHAANAVNNANAAASAGPGHHIPAEILLDYAAGTLPESWSLVVACHLSLCPECRRDLQAAEAMGGAMLAAESVPPDLESLLQRLGPQDGRSTPASRAVNAPGQAASKPALPRPLAAYLPGPIESLPWSWAGAGVRSVALPVPTGKGGMVSLLRIEPGRAMPVHTHRGEEMTLVLAGGFTDEFGSFTRGDVEIADGDVLHQPVAMAGEACICLAVTDAPLSFRGRFGWLLNQWTRLFS